MAVESRTVLIVDDDPQVLRLVEKMLRPRSISLRIAHLPAEALRICESETVDLLITDVAMPELDGTKLAKRALQLQPKMMVLLISGVNADPPELSGAANVRFLKKPFFPSELLQHVRELLPGV